MAKILLTGSTGQIGRELRRTLAPLGEVIAPPRGRLDLARPDSIRSTIRETRPAIVVNAAAFAAMDPAEKEPGLALLVNAVAPGIIAEEAKSVGAALVHYSSAYVFDGTAARPYVEDDAPSPVNVYGRSKLAGEQAIAATGIPHLILRLSWVHSLHGTNFLSAILKLAREKAELDVVDDQIGSPTWAVTIAQATARTLEQWRPGDGPAGLFHLSAAGRVSRYEFAAEIISAARRAAGGAGWAQLRPIASSAYPLPAARPKYCELDSSKIARSFGIEMPHWRDQVRDCLGELSAAG